MLARRPGASTTDLAATFDVVTLRPATDRSGHTRAVGHDISGSQRLNPLNRSLGRWRGEDGFTLSELILVSVFVVGLIFVAVNAARGIEDGNRRSNCQTELRNLKMAVAEQHAETGTYPESVEDLVEAGTVEREAVDSWALVSESPGEPPDYVPVAGRC